jgi:hypothetical protein
MVWCGVQMTPDNSKEVVEKPPEHTICPEGNHVLRVKQLRPIKFTKSDGSDSDASASASSSSSSSSASAAAAKKPATDEKSAGAGAGAVAVVSGVKNRFMCPSCRRGLSNVIKLSCLSKCGHVLCNQCVDKFVRKDKSCVHCGDKVNNPDKDIIPMAFGGTCLALLPVLFLPPSLMLFSVAVLQALALRLTAPRPSLARMPRLSYPVREAQQQGPSACTLLNSKR